MIKTYLFLAGAVLFEVAGTMLLPLTQNFTKLIPTAVGISFVKFWVKGNNIVPATSKSTAPARNK